MRGDAVRVIAGTLRGRRLMGPPRGAETRPTADRVREAVFSVVGATVEGARVLDLFAGTGAMGIEALSRGAAHAVFIESDRGLCETIQTNLENLEITERARVLRRDVRRAIKTAPGPFDLVFIDPPYGHLLEREALGGLVAHGMLAPDALVLVEHAAREIVAPPTLAAEFLTAGPTRTYGDAAITCFRPSAVGATDPSAQIPTAEASVTVHPDSENLPVPARRTAVYAGSFDPPTYGHIDVIRRAALLFDRIVVAVARNRRKDALFEPADRAELLRASLVDVPGVEVDLIDGGLLLVEYARRRGATAVIRGMRAVADFEYEFQMACMNHHLAPTVETVFLMTAQEYFYVSSSLVKEVALLGGDVSPFVPPPVVALLNDRYAARAK